MRAMHYILSFFFPLPFLLFLSLFITLRRNAGNEFNCLDEWKWVQRRQTHVECKQISNSSIQEAIKHKLDAELDDTRYAITTSRDPIRTSIVQKDLRAFHRRLEESFIQNDQQRVPSSGSPIMPRAITPRCNNARYAITSRACYRRSARCN